MSYVKKAKKYGGFWLFLLLTSLFWTREFNCCPVGALLLPDRAFCWKNVVSMSLLFFHHCLFSNWFPLRMINVTLSDKKHFKYVVMYQNRTKNKSCKKFHQQYLRILIMIKDFITFLGKVFYDNFSSIGLSSKGGLTYYMRGFVRPLSKICLIFEHLIALIGRSLLCSNAGHLLSISNLLVYWF